MNLTLSPPEPSMTAHIKSTLPFRYTKCAEIGGIQTEPHLQKYSPGVLLLHPPEHIHFYHTAPTPTSQAKKRYPHLAHSHTTQVFCELLVKSGQNREGESIGCSRSHILTRRLSKTPGKWSFNRFQGSQFQTSFSFHSLQPVPGRNPLVAKSAYFSWWAMKNGSSTS